LAVSTRNQQTPSSARATTIANAAPSAQDHPRVRAHAWGRLGHRERRADFAAQQRAEPALALARRSDVQQRVDVGLVRRRAAHGAGPQQAAAGLFEHACALQPVQPQAAVLGRELRGDEPAGQCLGAQLARHAVQRCDIVGDRHVFARDDDLVDEAPHALAQRIEFGRRTGRCPRQGLDGHRSFSWAVRWRARDGPFRP